MRLNRSFRDTDGAWRDHSFLATFLRLEELKLCYLFRLFVFIKLFKEKHEKGSERCWFCGVVGRAPSAVIDASAACLFIGVK